MGQVGFDKTMSIDDELESLRLSALYEMGDDGFVTDVEIGFNNSVREKSHSSDENFLRLAAPIAVPTSIRQSPVDYGFVGFGNIMAYDPIAAVNSGIYTVAPNLGLGELQRRWNVKRMSQPSMRKLISRQKSPESWLPVIWAFNM